MVREHCLFAKVGAAHAEGIGKRQHQAKKSQHRGVRYIASGFPVGIPMKTAPPSSQAQTGFHWEQ